MRLTPRKSKNLVRGVTPPKLLHEQAFWSRLSPGKAEAQPTLVSPYGDTEKINEETNESDDEDSSIAGTPHAKTVRKQRYASKLLKRRINNINEPVSQVYLPEETDWKIHSNSTAELSQKSEWSNYR